MGYKNYIREATGLLREKLFLNHYRMYYDFNPPFDKKDTTVAAEIDIDYTYFLMHLKFGRILKRKYRDRRLEEVINILTHEMMHVVVDRLYEFAINAANNSTGSYLEQIRENTVQHMTNIFMMQVRLDQFEFDKLDPPSSDIIKKESIPN